MPTAFRFADLISLEASCCDQISQKRPGFQGVYNRSVRQNRLPIPMRAKAIGSSSPFGWEAMTGENRLFSLVRI